MLLCLRLWHHLPIRRFFCRSSLADTENYKETFARKMAMAGIKPHHRIALGVSGGPDSIALCVLTAGWKTDGLIGRGDTNGWTEGLLGVVVDHRLRAGSSEEAEQVRDRVLKMGVRCEIACCDWSEGRPKQGHLQEAAREMRYQIFQDVCVQQKIGVLLIAHHADDQAELFIMRLSRNSGVLGLAGMAFASQIFPMHLNWVENSGNQGILLVRPLLEFSKDDMYKICQEGHQEWVEDPTNQSQLFARNRIRISIGNLPSCSFRLEMQKLISACRSTRSYIESKCQEMIKDSVIIMDCGYAIIDLEKLELSTVEDICLSRFLALILQFISQRHRPIRGSVSQLLLDYMRNFPCKTSLTAAGCYLCPAPRSKGTKVLVCSSLDSPQPSRTWSSPKYSDGDQQPSLLRELDHIILDARSHSDRSVSKPSNASFLHVKSSEILIEAKKLNLIGESTFSSILELQQEESRNFSTGSEVGSNHKSSYEMKLPSSSSIQLRPGESCYFMSRFLVTWKISNEGNEGRLCPLCMADERRMLAVRHMVDGDWLHLAELSEQVSAQRALKALKSVPVAARRGLPVLVDSQGLLLSIPSIDFRSCPCLSVIAVFMPRVPLGGGYSSYL